MNEIEKLKESANKIALINSALNRSVTYVLREYGPMCEAQPKTARRYLASMCATVVGGYFKVMHPNLDPKIIAKLIEIELSVLAVYIASNGDNLIEIDTEEG